jgi:hypothetical protein
MEILDFSKERGIHAIFNGYGKQAYIFHSSFYGFVGYADIEEEPGEDNITVEIYLPNASKWWYWSLESIVKRGIRKAENKFVKKAIKFKVHWMDKVHDNGEPSNVDCVFGNNTALEISVYDGVVEI